MKENEKAKQKGLFNKRKWQNLHLGWGNPGCTDRVGNERLEGSATERDPRSWMIQS